MKGVVVLVLILIVSSIFVTGEPVNPKPLKDRNVNLIWDFIVVGAGAAGSVVASRLANETGQTILLLEGGAIGSGQRDLGGDDYVASYFDTDPVTGNQKRGVPLTRYDVPTMADSIRLAIGPLENMWDINATGPFFTQAKVVGGNMATNGMAWLVPQKVDFDGWGLSDYTGAKMWPYMMRIENAAETGIVNLADRGYGGKTNIKFASFVQLEQIRFQNASISAGYPAGTDMNTGTIQSKIYLSQNNIKRGIRESSSLTYLAPLLKRNQYNLEFRKSAVVTCVLFDIFNRATGVEYYDEELKVLVQVFALKEVIIAAGTLQTAKILYNSGIGPASILRAFNKPMRVVNEMIGQKIRNHQRVGMVYTDPTIINANFYNYPAASIQYASQGIGIIEGKALFYLNFYSGYGPAPYPDIQAIPGPVAGATPTDVYGRGITVTVVLNRNLYANGTVNLTSSDPLAGTAFNANVFLIDEDVQRLARGVLEIRRVMTFWNGSATETAPGPSYDTVEKLIPWIRSHSSTACHYYSSAPMGTGPEYPVDDKMLVKGVQRLRLAGPAVVPNMVYPGMQALAVAMGEKATDLIKDFYNL